MLYVHCLDIPHTFFPSFLLLLTFLLLYSTCTQLNQIGCNLVIMCDNISTNLFYMLDMIHLFIISDHNKRIAMQNLYSGLMGPHLHTSWRRTSTTLCSRSQTIMEISTETVQSWITTILIGKSTFCLILWSKATTE